VRVPLVAPVVLDKVMCDTLRPGTALSKFRLNRVVVVVASPFAVTLLSATATLPPPEPVVTETPPVSEVTVRVAPGSADVTVIVIVCCPLITLPEEYPFNISPV